MKAATTGERRLEGHAAGQPEGVVERRALAVVSPHAATAERRAAAGVVDGDNRPETGLRVVAGQNVLEILEGAESLGGHALLLRGSPTPVPKPRAARGKC